MAVFNEINVGRYNRALQKLLQIKGGPPVPSLGGEIVPGLDFFLEADTWYLQGWEAFGAALQASASVGQNSAIRFRNPASANIVAIFDHINVRTSLAETDLGLAIAFNQTTDLGALGTNQQIDPRGRSSSSIITSVGNNIAGIGLLIDTRSIAANVTSDEYIVQPNASIILLPGAAIQFRTLVNNLNLIVSARWRERFLEESERF